MLTERQGDRARGQGVNDMKGGDVIMIEALRALKSVGVRDRVNVEILFTGDEERTGTPLQAARADMVTVTQRLINGPLGGPPLGRQAGFTSGSSKGFLPSPTAPAARRAAASLSPYAGSARASGSR